MQNSRITRRTKKVFLSVQCEEIEENNRMGKIRDLFKKIRDTKGIFHANMATVEFSKFAGILSAALSQHHLSGFEVAQLEFHHLH